MAAPEQPSTPMVAVLGPQEPNTIVVVMGGRVARADVVRLCAQVRALLDRDAAEVIVCDVARVEVDAVVVEAICRLELTARRAGRVLRLRHVSCELRALLVLSGLTDVLLCS